MADHINKFVYYGDVKFDLTADSVTPDKLLYGFTAHDNTGAAITGTCEYDVDSGDATVNVAEILDGKTAYARGAKLTGTMPNNGGVSLTISAVDDAISIAQGYHDGSGKVSIAEVERAKLIASNIKQGITILGITGTLEPSSAVTVQPKTVTPAKEQQIVTPDPDYDYLSQVTVNGIPYTETPNSAGGITITIG